MQIPECPMCGVATLVPHEDYRDCRRAWCETTIMANDLLLTRIGIPSLPTSSRTPWPDAREIQRRLGLAHARLQQWEALYRHIAEVLRATDLPVPSWTDPDLFMRLLVDIRIVAERRPHTEKSTEAETEETHLGAEEEEKERGT